MADKIISATLKVNTGTSAADIGAVNKQLDNTSKELGDVESDAKTTTGSFTNLKSGLSQLPGPLGAVNQGVNTVSTSLKTLAANPIVLVVTLLVAALVALYKAFASTEAGAEKIEQVFSGLGAIVTVIKERVLQFANAIISFFKGDFKEAAQQASAAFTGVGDAITTAYSRAIDITRRLQEAQDELNRDILVGRAKLDRDLARSKELISDTTASYQERKKALDDVREAEGKQADQELANAKKTLVATIDQYNADKTSADKKDAAFKAQADFYALQAAQAADRRNINKQDAQIEADNQQKLNEAQQKAHDAQMKRLAEQKQSEKELQEAEKERIEGLRTLVDNQYKFNLDLQKVKDQEREAQKKKDAEDLVDMNAQFNAEQAAEQAANAKYIKGVNDTAAKEKKIAEALAAAKIQAAQSVGNALGALADLIGKQTVAGKALAISQAIINTYLGVTEALKQPSALPSPFDVIAKIANVATVIATGLAAVRNISSVDTSGGSTGSTGGSISTSAQSAATSAPIAPTQQGTTIDQTSIAGIGNAVSGRSYVLAQDVTHDQDRNERLNRAARLGG